MKQPKQKSIAFYIGNLSRGGAERVIVNLAAYFKVCGYCVTIVTKEEDTDEYPVPNGVRRILADITGKEVSRSRIVNLYRRIAKLRSIWKDIQPDYIVSFIKKNNFMAVVSSFGMRIPVIVSVRSNPAREYPDVLTRFLANVLFKHAAGVVLQTQMAKSFFKPAVQKKAVVLPNSLSETFLQSHDIGTRRKEIVWVGRMDSNKNPTMLLHAFLEMAGQYPEWSLKYVGDGVLLEKLKDTCQNSEYGKRVSFLGSVKDVAEVVRESSVFVLTSKQEGMPNALIEAMVSGLAVIATDCPCGGPAELIENGENGILIPVEDEKALKEALIHYMSDAEYRKKMGQKALCLIDRVHPDIVNRKWREYVESIRY